MIFMVDVSSSKIFINNKLCNLCFESTLWSMEQMKQETFFHSFFEAMCQYTLINFCAKLYKKIIAFCMIPQHWPNRSRSNGTGDDVIIMNWIYGTLRSSTFLFLFVSQIKMWVTGAVFHNRVIRNRWNSCEFFLLIENNMFTAQPDCLMNS